MNPIVRSHIMNLRLVLIFVSCARSQPILSQIGQIFENLGFQYVPPTPTSEEKVSHVGLFQPVVKEEIPNAVVFNETDGWLQTSGSDYLYRLGSEAATYYEARYWCQQVGGRLAEIYNQDEMETVRALAKRQPNTDFWLGLKKSARSWLTGTRRDYQNWNDGEPNIKFEERCVVISHASHYRWAGCNCGSQSHGSTQLRALCQKEVTNSITSTTPGPEIKSELPESPRCEVNGVSLTGDDWISRHVNVSSSSKCRTACLNTYHCNFWTWRADSRLCYLKTEDGHVVEDVFSVSGTTSASQGCHNKLLDLITSGSSPLAPVEYCSCKTVSLGLVEGYIDPRALTSTEQTDTEELQLGRLITHRACPPGQVLSCTDDQHEVVAAKVPRSNITDCLVYDVRLTVGGLISKVVNVATPSTCHAHCLATPGCLYWTWRGDTPARKCFLLPHEGRTVRRQRAASGSVASSLGCNHEIPEEVEAREEQEECDCQPDRDYDLVTTGLIDPRALPSGRIVNTQTPAVTCPPGYRRVCHFPKTESQQTDGPKLWSSGLSAGPARNIPKRETESDSAVNFPQ